MHVTAPTPEHNRQLARPAQDIEGSALLGTAARVDEDFAKAAETDPACRSRVVVAGKLGPMLARRGRGGHGGPAHRDAHRSRPVAVPRLQRLAAEAHENEGQATRRVGSRRQYPAATQGRLGRMTRLAQTRQQA